HASLGNLRTAILGTRCAKIRKGGKGQVLRDVPLTENVAESCLYIRRNLMRSGLSRDGHPEALLDQPADTLQSLVETAFAPVLVVPRPVRKIEADPEVDRIGIVQQRQHLVPAFQQRLGGVGE